MNHQSLCPLKSLLQMSRLLIFISANCLCECYALPSPSSWDFPISTLGCDDHKNLVPFLKIQLHAIINSILSFANDFLYALRLLFPWLLASFLQLIHCLSACQRFTWSFTVPSVGPTSNSLDVSMSMFNFPSFTQR